MNNDTVLDFDIFQLSVGVISYRGWFRRISPVQPKYCDGVRSKRLEANFCRGSTIYSDATVWDHL